MNQGFGQPPHGGQGGPQGQPPQPAAQGEPPTNIGLIVAGLWLAVGFLGCLATGAGAALLGEGEAVMVSYLGLPLFVSGVSAMIIAPFLRSKGVPAAVGAPVGCGCAGFLFSMVAIVVFYQAIWPSL